MPTITLNEDNFPFDTPVIIHKAMNGYTVNERVEYPNIPNIATRPFVFETFDSMVEMLSKHFCVPEEKAANEVEVTKLPRIYTSEVYEQITKTWGSDEIIQFATDLLYFVNGRK